MGFLFQSKAFNFSMDNRPDGMSGPNPSSDSDSDTTTTSRIPPHAHVLDLPSSTAALSSRDATAVPFLNPPPPPCPWITSLQHAPATMDIDSNTEDRSRRATSVPSVLSMDDIEAAQALEGLRSDRASSQQTSTDSEMKQPEPLLSLLTSTHPLISSAINGSMSAYTSSKSYSPRFKYGAEFIERNIGSPVANTVGTVGRKTGVESGLRWALQRRESSAEANRSKRRKVNGKDDQVDVEKGLQDPMLAHRVRSSSDLSVAESLPPYDDHRSPNYEEVGGDSSSAAANPRQTPPTWQSRLMISTSGLGVAMSEESLRSLQYCLTWLRWANGRLGKSIIALQTALKEWENSSKQHQNAEDGSRASSHTLLSQRIQAVKEDVLSTLKQVVDVVSKYAGGALPENARNLVRKHLTSLPKRFQIASTSNPPPDSTAASSEATLGAHRILVLAQEGLDMMAQVSGVVNETLVSAEHWCARLGKKRPERDAKRPEDGQHPEPSAHHHMDVKQPIVLETGVRDVQMGGMEKA